MKATKHGSTITKAERKMLIERIVEQMESATTDQLRAVWYFCSRMIK